MKVDFLGCRVIKYPLTEELLTSQLNEWVELGFQPVRILFSVEVQEPNRFHDAFKRMNKQTSDLDLKLCSDYQIDFALEKGL